MSEVMIDIESLSVNPTAAIITIGALKFNRSDRIKPFEEYNCFYRRIELSSMKDAKLDFHIDPDTVKWWENQSEESRNEALYNKDRIPLKQALEEFKQWYGNPKCVWAKSPSFDCTIMEHAYRQFGMELPWKFWTTRDVRTVMDLGGVHNRDLHFDNAHHAAYDCYNQIIAVKMSIDNIKK